MKNYFFPVSNHFTKLMFYDAIPTQSKSVKYGGKDMKISFLLEILKYGRIQTSCALGKKPITTVELTLSERLSTGHFSLVPKVFTHKRFQCSWTLIESAENSDILSSKLPSRRRRRNTGLALRICVNSFMGIWV